MYVLIIQLRNIVIEFDYKNNKMFIFKYINKT